jgi:hypothetical protein
MDTDNEQDELWNQKRLCRKLDISEKTADAWRSKRIGPAYLKIGGGMRYRAEDVYLYIENQRISTETQK